MSFCAHDEYQKRCKVNDLFLKTSLIALIFHLYAYFCSFVIRIIQHNLAFPVHLSNSLQGGTFVCGLYLYDATQHF